jgi:hypothetical protein
MGDCFVEGLSGIKCSIRRAPSTLLKGSDFDDFDDFDAFNAGAVGA